MANYEIFDLSEETTPTGTWNLAIQKTLGGAFYRMALSNLLASFKVTAQGDVLYGSAASTLARLGIGTAGYVLKVNSGGTLPEWGTVTVGEQRKYISVGEMQGSASPPAESYVSNFPVLAYDPASYETALASMILPKRWNAGNLFMRVWGIQSGTNTGNCIFGVYMQSVASGDTVGSWTGKTFTIALPGVNNRIFNTGWSSAYYDASFAKEDYMPIQIQRRGSDAGDTYPDDFNLLGVEFKWTSDAENDA